ncbi:MAG: rhomboid family intramembrane serine protease [bacterium]
MENEKIRFFRSFFYPTLLVLILWLVKAVEYIFSVNLSEYGLHPLQVKGIPGIFTSPFLHADLAHLFANSFPLLILGALLFYFYEEIAWQILFLLYLVTGIWVWTFARGHAVHNGASGVIYGLAAFLFFSGIIRRETRLMVITLLVTFLYGGLIWGVFPQFFPSKPISWESHMMGLLAGLILAFYFRKAGPQQKTYEWEEEEEDGNDEDAEDPEMNQGSEESGTHPEIRYHPPEH